MNILPIGSILARGESKITILGYQINEDENHSILYKCAQYPIGFVNEDECIYIKSDTECTVLHTGYENDDFMELSTLINDIRDAYNEYGMKEVNDAVEEIVKRYLEAISKEEEEEIQ